MNRFYERGIRWALPQYQVGLVALLLIALPVIRPYLRLGTGFLPEMDEGGFVVDYLTRRAPRFRETNSIAQKMEQKGRQAP